MSKKIVLISAIIIIGIVIILQVPGIAKKIIIEYVENIDYDIKVTYVEAFPAETGYAAPNTYYLINIEDRKIYEICDYYVFGENCIPIKNGHNYTVITNKISEDTINSIIGYVEQEIDETESSQYPYKRGHWLVEYNDKTAKINNFNYSTAPNRNK